MAGYDGGGGGGGESFGIIDKAETFAESDVTVTSPNAPVSGEAIVLDTAEYAKNYTDTTAIDSDGSWHGYQFTADEDLQKIEVVVGATGWTGDMRLRDLDAGVDVAYETDAVSGGSTWSASGTPIMEAGVTYEISNNMGGGDWPYEQSPATSPQNNLPQGITWVGQKNPFNGADDVTVFETVRVTKKPTAASATVEWPHPPDLFGWDSATFQVAPDGETAEVYIEESTDGGATWTEVAGPISRGDDIPVASVNEMRFRVDLSRADTANSPRVESIYRRYTV